MKERPILFSAPMIKALLAGTKTQTRRIIKPAIVDRIEVDVEGFPTFIHGPKCLDLCEYGCDHSFVVDGGNHVNGSPYGATGDRLWVRETHQFVQLPNERIVVYRATCDDDSFMYVDPVESSIEQIKVHKWKPAIFMRRLESRILLEIESIRVERLQNISEEDAKAEGVDRDTEPCDHTRLSCDEIGCMGPTFRSSYAALWMEINGEDSWKANPWVWVVSFKRVEAA